MNASKFLNNSKHSNSIPLILEIGSIMGKITCHEKGYLQIPVNAKTHKDLISTIDSVQCTITRGTAGIGYALAAGQDVGEYARDLGWLLNGMAELRNEDSIIPEF